MLGLTMMSQGVLSEQSGAVVETPFGVRGTFRRVWGPFDCATASRSRSSRFAQDDRSEVVSSERSSTYSTLLEPVAWSCFRILASKDASRISMVMASSLGLRVREGVW